MVFTIKNILIEKRRREKISVAMKKIKKLRKEKLGYINSKETRLKMSNIMKEKWKNPEFANKMFSLSRNKYPNKCESSLLIVLKGIDPNWDFVGNGNFIIGHPPKNPDFINIKEKQIIEFFGKHWHKKEEEEKLIQFYNSLGWNCIVLWDYEIKRILKGKEDIQFLLKKIYLKLLYNPFII